MPAKSILSFYPRLIILFLLSISTQLAYANQLPPVTGADYDGEQISWDSMLGAAGYNIYLEFEYIDTVIGSTRYVPSKLGEYRIAAFDNNGRYSPLQIIKAGVIPTSNIAIVDRLPDDDKPEEPPENADQLPPVSGANFDGQVISWDSLNGAIGYNIYLEFSYLDTVVDGTRYTPIISGEYRIAAFDSEGRYSPLQVIEDDVVDTGNVVIVDLDQPNDLPSIPQNVSLAVYSQTAAELFWDRPPLNENVAITEIFRNDVLLGTSPGTSFYDDSRIANAMYTYKLVAINSNGERSLPAIVNPDPLDGEIEEAVLALMGGISDVTNNNPHVQWFSTLRNLTTSGSPLTRISTELVRNEDDILVTRSIYSCDAGEPGLLTIDQIDSRFGIFTLEFDVCSISGALFEGDLAIVGTDIGGYNAIYQDLEVLAGDTATFMNGAVSLNIGRAVNFMSLTYTDFDYGVIGNLVDEDGLDTNVVLNQVLTDSTVSEPRNTLTTNFSVSAPWTRGETVEVETTAQFTGADIGDGNYLTGELSVLTTSGDSVLVNADTGNAETWTANVSLGDDNITVNGNWNESGKLPCLSVTRDENALSGCFER